MKKLIIVTGYIKEFESSLRKELLALKRGRKRLVYPEYAKHPAQVSKLITELIEQEEKEYFIFTQSQNVVHTAGIAIKNKTNKLAVECYYIDETGKFHQITIQTNGRVHNAPAGFFDQTAINLRKLFLG